MKPSAVCDELNRSKTILEQILGREVDSLAYPHGSYNKVTSEVSIECGLHRRLTLEERMVSASSSEGEIGRFSMDPDVWPIEFRLTADGAYSWLYYFRNAIRACRAMVRQ